MNGNPYIKIYEVDCLDHPDLPSSRFTIYDYEADSKVNKFCDFNSLGEENCYLRGDFESCNSDCPSREDYDRGFVTLDRWLNPRTGAMYSNILEQVLSPKNEDQFQA